MSALGKLPRTIGEKLQRWLLDENVPVAGRLFVDTVDRSIADARAESAPAPHDQPTPAEVVLPYLAMGAVCFMPLALAFAAGLGVLDAIAAQWDDRL